MNYSDLTATATAGADPTAAVAPVTAIAGAAGRARPLLGVATRSAGPPAGAGRLPALAPVPAATTAIAAADPGRRCMCVSMS